MSPRRPKKPDVLPPGSGKPVVEGARRAIHGPDPEPLPGPEYTALINRIRRDLLTVPPDDFKAGVEAEKLLREDVCPGGVSNPLGPWIAPLPRPENTREIGGQGKYALFEPFMLDWFDELTPELTAAMTVSAKRQVRRTIFWQIVRENRVRAVAVGGSIFAAFQWGVSAWEWVLAHLPAIQSLLKLLRTGAVS